MINRTLLVFLILFSYPTHCMLKYPVVCQKNGIEQEITPCCEKYTHITTGVYGTKFLTENNKEVFWNGQSGICKKNEFMAPIKENPAITFMRLMAKFNGDLPKN